VVVTKEVSSEKGSLLIPIILAGAATLIIIVIVVVLVIRKGPPKEAKEEEEISLPERHGADYDPPVTEVVKSDVPITLQEAHAQLGKNRPKTYEELYGTKPPS
jgi:flagellar basal body-associated protein FliL